MSISTKKLAGIQPSVPRTGYVFLETGAGVLTVEAPRGLEETGRAAIRVGLCTLRVRRGCVSPSGVSVERSLIL